MFEESSRVILTGEIMEFGLAEGTTGTVLTIHGNGEEYDVDFTNEAGETLAILTVEAAKLRLAPPPPEAGPPAAEPPAAEGPS